MKGPSVMNQSMFTRQARLDAIRQRAHGRWGSILLAMGVDPGLLNGKNQPCPGCGGEDRYQYTDAFGEGNYFCRGCGPGGGFKLAQAALGLGFNAVLDAVEQQLGAQQVLPSLDPGKVDTEHLRDIALRIWDEALPVCKRDEVDRYLSQRGLGREVYPRTLRFHPALGVYERQAGGHSVKVGECAAMVAGIQAPDGEIVAVHRTFLKDGQKALGRQSKRVLGKGIQGAAVRLAASGEELAITEGIETALAVGQKFDVPVWAAMNCGNLEQVQIPPTVKRVTIYADNDADSEFAGQLAAYSLAQRLVKEDKRFRFGRTVRVMVPTDDGSDWAD